MKKEISKEQIIKLIPKIKIKTLEKIDAGFTNTLFRINKKYILKICKKKSNEEAFRKEILCYKYLNKKIKHPKLITSDISKKKIPYLFMIYKEIKGQNGYAKWHLLSNKNRKKIIKEVCFTLKKINQSEVEGINPKNTSNWKQKRITSINKGLKKVNKKQIISEKFLEKIKNYVQENKEVLNESKEGLVYWDLHLDNIILKNKKFQGLIDFEDIDIMSIDFVLDTVFRWAKYPKLYASEKDEIYIKKEDYKHIKKWFKIYYPELFDFKSLNKRIALYSIEYDLKLLIKFPKCNSLKERLANTIRYKSKIN